MAESIEVLQAVESGYMRTCDIAPYLGVTRQRVDQLVGVDGFPRPRIVAGRRLWLRSAIERWAERHWWGTKPWRREGAAT
jgi:predicted DNA-binding transcriptional regulator AlpA